MVAARSPCGLLNQSHTRSINYLASFRFRSSNRGSDNATNFGIGTLEYCRKARLGTSPVVNGVPAGHPVPMKALVNLKASIKAPPPLEASMTCEAAFRAAATHYLHQLTAGHEDTAAGDPTALHAMRIATTRLRTTITLFSPMVEGDEQVRLAAELKWLHAHLGIVRDLDVALERLAKIKPAISDRPWIKERAACQR